MDIDSSNTAVVDTVGNSIVPVVSVDNSDYSSDNTAVAHDDSGHGGGAYQVAVVETDSASSQQDAKHTD